MPCGKHDYWFETARMISYFGVADKGEISTFLFITNYNKKRPFLLFPRHIADFDFAIDRLAAIGEKMNILLG